MAEHRIILFRGMNTGGVRAPVAEQCAMATEMGLGNPRTLLASGNLVVESDAPTADLEVAIEKAMEARFGLKIAAMVRTPEQWRALMKANPFPDEAQTDPACLLMMVMKDGITDGAVEALRGFAVGGEKVEAAGGALWLWHPEGIGQSKMADRAQPRLTGMGTARNWNTVGKLAEMTEAGDR